MTTAKKRRWALGFLPKRSQNQSLLSTSIFYAPQFSITHTEEHTCPNYSGEPLGAPVSYNNYYLLQWLLSAYVRSTVPTCCYIPWPTWATAWVRVKSIHAKFSMLSHFHLFIPRWVILYLYLHKTKNLLNHLLKIAFGNSKLAYRIFVLKKALQLIFLLLPSKTYFNPMVLAGVNQGW